MPTRFATLIVLFLAPFAHAQEWTRFRGPNGSGVGEDVRIPDQLKPAWKVKLPGVGHSSPVLWHDRLFVTSADDAASTLILQCLDATDGKELWRRDFGVKKHGMHKDNSLASPTPAVTDKLVVVCWASAGEFVAAALDHDGKEKWKVDVGAYRSGHGFGASPIVHDDIVVLANEQEGDSKVIALDLATGKIRWQTPRKSRAQWSTPCIYRPKGQPGQVIFASWEHGISSFDPATGKPNWELDAFDKKHIESSIASPIVAGDRILATSGWLGVRQETVAVQLHEGKPRATDPILYRLDKSAPLVPTPLVKDNLVFSWNDRGVVSCADLVTGKEYWRERVDGNFYASPVCSGSRLCSISREGNLIVLSASKEYSLLATIPLGEGSHSTPALARGKTFVRTFRHLWCLNPR